MPKNQLFKIVPDLQIIQAILEAFGLDDIEDTRIFTKEHMKENTVWFRPEKYKILLSFLQVFRFLVQEHFCSYCE